MNQSSQRTLRAISTEGDFPHVRRRSVRLACCSCTCCCFTILVGGLGTVAGLITGIVKTVTAGRSAAPITNPALAGLAGFLRVIVVLVVYTVAGLLIGAAVGFGMDYLFVF